VEYSQCLRYQQLYIYMGYGRRELGLYRYATGSYSGIKIKGTDERDVFFKR